MNIYLGKLSLIIVFNFYISASLIFCQQGKYKRKSITSLGTYTASGNSLKYYLGNQIHLKQILDNPRFDYNVIGNQFIENFNNALEDQTIFRSNNKFSINLNPLGGNFLRHKDMPDIL